MDAATSPEERGVAVCKSTETAKLETTDAATSTVFPQKSSPDTRNMVSQTSHPRVNNKATQIYKFTLSTDASTMTTEAVKSNNSTVSTSVASNTVIDLGLMNKKLSDLDKSFERYKKLEAQYEEQDRELQLLVQDFVTYKKFAKDELKIAVSKTAEKLDRFVPTRELAWVKRTVHDIIDRSLCALYNAGI